MQWSSRRLWFEQLACEDPRYRPRLDAFRPLHHEQERTSHFIKLFHDSRANRFIYGSLYVSQNDI
jgi:hypothetical protein